VAQLPPIIESLTGIKFEKLIEQVPGLRKSMGVPEVEDKKKGE
jgi:flotillin